MQKCKKWCISSSSQIVPGAHFLNQGYCIVNFYTGDFIFSGLVSKVRAPYPSPQNIIQIQSLKNPLVSCGRRTQKERPPSPVSSVMSMRSDRSKDTPQDLKEQEKVTE